MFKFIVISISLIALLSVFAFATTVTLYPTDDSYVWEDASGSNYGSQNTAYIGMNSNGTLWSYFLFNVSPYSGETINDASLQLYITGQGYSFPFDDELICTADEAWDESTITWNSRPYYDQYFATTTHPSVGSWWSIDITTWTTEWVDGTESNYGVYLIGHPPGSDNGWCSIATKEYSGTSYDPKLVLDYGGSSIEATSLGNIKATFK